MTLIAALVALLLGARRRWRAGAEPARRRRRCRRAAPPFPPTPQQIARGAYLARAGNCVGLPHRARRRAVCRRPRHRHAVRHRLRQQPHARRRAPASAAGSAADFWRALHNGRSQGRPPALPGLPLPELHAGHARRLRRAVRLPAQPAAGRRSRTGRTRCASRTTRRPRWRCGARCSSRPACFAAEAGAVGANGTAAPTWCAGLGHCIACHARAQRARRDATAARPARRADPDAELVRAVAHVDPREAGVADWPAHDIVALLQTGVSPRALGDGADGRGGLAQHAAPDRTPTCSAMAVYLKALPQARRGGPHRRQRRDAGDAGARRARSTTKHCADCHGADGQGAAGAYPPLAGNRAVTMAATANLIQHRRSAAASRRRPPAIRGPTACRRSARRSTTPTSPPC